MLLLGSADSTHAQRTTIFPSDSIQFFDQLDDYFREYTYRHKRKEGRAFIEKFEVFWYGGYVDTAHRNAIYKTCNTMLKERMKPFPAFYEYLNAVLYLRQNNFPDSVFNDWHISLQPLISIYNQKKFVDYLESSRNIFGFNCLYESSSAKWDFKKGAFRFIYDSIPRFEFPSIDLICYASGDSSRILKTTGVYYPSLYKWKGKGGKVTWERAGFSPDSVYAELDNYEINVKFSQYEADSVAFRNKLFFDQAYLGKLKEKILSGVKPSNVYYPQFYSYTNEIHIPDLYGHFIYSGGFAMEGAKVIGTAVGENNASLVVRQNDSVFLQFNARKLFIRENSITTERSEFTLFHGQDSIYHPGLRLRYTNPTREISVYRDDKGLAGSPFYNSYHNIDMYPEAFYWKLGSDSVYFSMLRGVSQEGEAIFESSNLFSAKRYYQMQGIDEVHPMNVIYQFWKKKQKRTFYLWELQHFMNKPDHQVKALLIRLTQLGFVLYNIESNRVTLKDRLFFYLKALAGRSDYDVIQFLSRVKSGNNAVLHLSSFDLNLKGVPRVSLSRNRQVYIFPEDENIILKKDLDFIFTGRVQAGYFDFFANECSFEYDKFQLNLHTVDSLVFYVPVKSKLYPQRDSIVRVRNVIAELNGDLRIDHPRNKSGEKPYPKFPVFTSKDDAFVYFDDKDIAGGLYKRDTFYYHVNPFTIDSLDKITTEGLKFNGFLVSGGIFPDIKEDLRVRPDFSLGFRAQTKDEGLPVYNGQGKYYREIDLSNKGLKGKGELGYLTAHAFSKQFHFYPDSVKARLDNVKISKAYKPVESPDVYGEKAGLKWYPFEENFILNNSTGNPFLMYDDQIVMDGTLFLGPNGLIGNGKLSFEDADMRSDEFAFNHHAFNTRKSYFSLKDAKTREFAISTQVDEAHVDLQNRIGNFVASGEDSRVEFPANQYICFMDEFDWYMDDYTLEFHNNIDQTFDNIDQLQKEDWIDLDLSGSQFISVHPAQDSLSFFALSALYNIKEQIIRADEVKIIRVADAAVFPYDGKVTIGHKADMRSLKKALLISDTATKYHKIYDANISIKSRNKYTGEGFVNYVNKYGNTTPLYLDTILIENGRTHGIARIKEEDSFMLSPRFGFMGEVHIRGGSEGFDFNGGYRVVNDCDNYAPEWVKFSAEIDPKDILLPVNDQLTNLQGDSVLASLNFLNTSNSIYPVFFNPKAPFIGESLLDARGYITYNEVADEYRIGSKGRLLRNNYADNYLALSTERCVMKGEGLIETGAGLGQLRLKTLGKINHFAIPDSTYLKTVSLMDFLFSDEAMDVMIGDIRTADLTGVEPGREVYEKSMRRLLGDVVYEDMMEDLQLYGTIRNLPDELNTTFTFSDLEFQWYNQTRSFVSQGQLGIGTINGQQLNRYVDGTIEIVKHRKTGDEINIYLEINPRNWYFFSYSNGVMQAISTNNKFNNILIDTPENKRMMDTERNEIPYQYIISTQMKRMQFVRKIQQLLQ